MNKTIKIQSFKNVKRTSLKSRKSKVEISREGIPHKTKSSFKEFMDRLPSILAAYDFRKAVTFIVNARRKKRPVILGMGAHQIKVGLSRVIIDLMERGILTGIATNGASIIHDFELSYSGHTSEDVLEELNKGTFGMAKETGVMLNMAINNGAKKGYGIGLSVGEFIYNDRRIKNRDRSIFAQGYKLGVPITVHVGIGTDIIHMHPEADGKTIGEGSLLDFRLLASLVTELEEGVFINLGSAVIIPEVFLKVLTLARNTGNSVRNFTMINMDFIKQYRASENILRRPTSESGTAIELIGHHEIMFPLLAAAVIEEIERK